MAHVGIRTSDITTDLSTIQKLHESNEHIVEFSKNRGMSCLGLQRYSMSCLGLIQTLALSPFSLHSIIILQNQTKFVVISVMLTTRTIQVAEY